MGKDEDKKDAPQSPWLWPAEWAVERSFWREVGTRTVSGVLTILLIGVPTLLWAAISGALQWETVAPIIVGVVLFGVLVTIYAIVVVGIRTRERRKIEATLRLEKYVSSVLPDPSMLNRLTPEQQRRVMAAISESGRTSINNAVRAARNQSLFAALGGLAAIITATIGLAGSTPFIMDMISGVFGANK